MNQLASWMMRLYPTRWRARYGDELNALIEDTGADARIVTDLFRGGMRMQLKTWPFPKLALALGLLGLLLGAGFARMLPSEYVSKATMQITPATIDDSMIQSTISNSLNERIQHIETQVLSRNSLTGIIKDPRVRLYADELREKPLDDVIEEMKQNISINFVALPGALGRRASAFDISFRYFDPLKAQQFVRELILAFEAESQRESAIASGQSDRGSLVVVSRAMLPDSPTPPSARAIAMFAGLALGVMLAALWRIVQRTGFIARRFAWIALAFGITGLAIVIAADKLEILPYQYRATTALQLQGGGPGEIPALASEAFSRTALSVVINDPRLRLYQEKLKTAPLEAVIQTMQRHLRVTQPGRNGLSTFNISFDYYDRYKAQEAVTMIADQLIETDQRMHPNGTLANAATPMVLEILDPASLPVSPTSPRRYMIAWTGCLIGFALAGVIALIRRRWKPEADFPVDALPE